MSPLQVFAFLFFCLALSSTTGGLPDDTPRAPQCPDPLDIFPCLCSVDEEEGGALDMDCTEVESEDQLAQVFASYFPHPHFRKLSMFQNKVVRRIRKGDLGNVSFQNIFLHNGVLEEIEDEAFSASYSTVYIIDLQLNHLVHFPFEELPLFVALDSLLLNTNRFPAFPPLASQSLTYLWLASNPFREIPKDGYRNLPNIQEIGLSFVQLEEIIPGTFVGFPDLHKIYLDGNKLSHLPAGAIEVGGTELKRINLQFNNISSIAVGSISGLKDGILLLDFNALEVLDEGALRPLLEEGARIRIRNNPLGCGCDIAWLLLNATFMNQTASDPPASCHDGVPLPDLDPSIYEEMC